MTTVMDCPPGTRVKFNSDGARGTIIEKYRVTMTKYSAGTSYGWWYRVRLDDGGIRKGGRSSFRKLPTLVRH